MIKIGDAARSFLWWRPKLMQRMDTALGELELLGRPTYERHILGRVACNDALWWHAYVQANGPGSKHAAFGFVPVSFAVESALIHTAARAAREHVCIPITEVWEHIGEAWLQAGDLWQIDCAVANCLQLELSRLEKAKLLTKLCGDLFQVRFQVSLVELSLLQRATWAASNKFGPAADEKVVDRLKPADALWR